MAVLNFFPGGSSAKDIGDATITLASSSFVYDGTEKTQGITSVTYNGTALTSGTDYIIVADSNKAINAGTHTIILAGIGNYTGIKTADWSIAKAQGSITSPVQSIAIDNYEGELSYTMTVVGDGVLSTSCPDGGQTISHRVNGNVVIIQAANNSNTTLTVTLEDGNNYLGASITIAITAYYINTTFYNNSPASIKRAVDREIAKNIWNVGDQGPAVTIPKFGYMTADCELMPFIIGFDHNKSIEGKGITLMFGKTWGGTDCCMIDSGYGNNYYSGNWFNYCNGDNNSCGWVNSLLRTWACDSFYNALPSAWKAVISDTTKYSNNGSSQSPNVSATTDKVFCLSHYELFANTNNIPSSEATYEKQYAYYSNGNSKVKVDHIGQSSTRFWWTRSTYQAPNSVLYYVRAVAGGGGEGYDYTSASLGFSPAFRVGPSNEVAA